jgi:hypothetical protein
MFKFTNIHNSSSPSTFSFNKIWMKIPNIQILISYQLFQPFLKTT